MKSLVNYLTLFASTSTLVCCALPALLVSIGLGATLAGVISQFPELIWISENKTLLFVVAGLLLLLNGFWLWKNKDAVCPLDPALRQSCLSGRKWSKNIYLLSLIVFATGGFFAFLA